MLDRDLQFSANGNLFNKTPPNNKSDYSNGFDAIEATIDDLEELIQHGVCFSYQYKDGIRKIENFLRTDILAVDMDGGRTIEECFEDPIVRKFGSLFYTTPSHSSDHHRFRLVFALQRTITKVEDLHCAARALTRRLGGDKSTTDAARMFYGSKGCWSKLLGSSITDEYLDELIEDGKIDPVSDSSSTAANIATSRSSSKLNPDDTVKTSNGILLKLKDIDRKTSIHCPRHSDRKPSAFVAINQRGSTYVHCRKCNITWWVKGNDPQIHDFNGFETEVRRIKSEGISDTKVTTTPLGTFPETKHIQAKNIHISDSKFLELSEIKDGLTLIKSPKGTGKTTYLANTLKKIINLYDTHEEFEDALNDNPNARVLSEEKILLIGHRRALIGDLCKRLGLDNYLEDKTFKKHEIYQRQLRYGVCLDSLWKVKDQEYDIIIIDEVEQVLGHFLSETVGSSRDKIFQIFSELLKSAKRIVVLDADLSWISFTTLFSIKTDATNIDLIDEPKLATNGTPLPVNIYINDWKPSNRSINIFPTDSQLIQHIKTSILEGKRIFITSNSKKKIKVLEKVVEKLGKEAPFDIPFITITSENSNSKGVQKFITNIKTEILNYKVILSSPSLGTGIDITFENNDEEIDCVYGIFVNLVNSHFEIDQQLARVRHPKEVNVWLSPASFQFETDVEVVTQDCLKSDLISSISGGIIHNSTYIRMPIPPMLKMAAQVTVAHRSSKNNLKQNFIEYKKAQNWAINWVETDKNLANEGNQIYSVMKLQTEQEEIDNILGATSINEYQYKKFMERIERFNESAEPNEWYDVFKTKLELFYGVPASEETVFLDNKGQYRKEIRRFESIQQKPEKLEETLTEARLNLIPNYHVGSSLLYKLFSQTPIFNKGVFETTVIFTMYDLVKFAEASKVLRKFVETQLGILTRKDVERKPVQHLGRLLTLVGLEIEKIDKPKRVKGTKIYTYQIKKQSLDTMLEITERRSIGDPSSRATGWPYVNKLHGFKYTDEELDYLSFP